MNNGAQVSNCNKYGETPLDKAKPPLRERLKGFLTQFYYLCYSQRLNVYVYMCICVFVCVYVCVCVKFALHPLFIPHTGEAKKMGQNLDKIPFKDTFWKGTTRTRPRKSRTNM